MSPTPMSIQPSQRFPNAIAPPSISHWLSLRTDRIRSASGRNPGQYEQVFRGVDGDAARFVRLDTGGAVNV